MSPREITLKLANGSSDSIPVNTVDTLRFAGEPSQLNAVRAAVRRGDFAAAHASLEKIPKDAKGLERAEIEQDYLFYQALCAARLALGSGHGETQRRRQTDAGFRPSSSPNSYHFIEASEALGDLLMGHQQARPGPRCLRQRRTSRPLERRENQGPRGARLCSVGSRQGGRGARHVRNRAAPSRAKKTVRP